MSPPADVGEGLDGYVALSRAVNARARRDWRMAWWCRSFGLRGAHYYRYHFQQFQRCRCPISIPPLPSIKRWRAPVPKRGISTFVEELLVHAKVSSENTQ